MLDDPIARDLVIRTVLGEAGGEGDDGQAAVAATIRNRLDAGRYGGSIPEIIMKKNAFEPWSSQAGRSRMMNYRSDSDEYRRAAANVDRAFAPDAEDITGGSTHFYAPQLQADLGRSAPKWAKGEGKTIGKHAFFAPEGRVERAKAAQSVRGIPEGFELIDTPASAAAAASAPKADAAAIPAGFELIPMDVKPDSFDARFAGDGPMPEQTTARELGEKKLQAAFDAGQKPNDQAVYRGGAFRTNEGVRPANATDAAVSEATMGWGDEISAGVRAPIDMLLRGETYDEAYQHNLAAERDRLDKFKSENPKTALAAGMVGGLASAPAKAKAGIEAAKAAVPTIRSLAGQSAILGGASGAGQSEGDVADRLLDGAVSGAIGGTVGLALPGVIKATKAVASPITRNVSAIINPEKRAADQIARDLARDKMTPAAARAELEAAEAVGAPMTLGDLGGRNVMGLTRSVATGKSAGSEKINSMLEARRLDAPDRVMNTVRESLASPEAFAPTLEGIIARRKELAAPLYEAAYAKAAPDTEIIRSILSTPAGKKAVADAKVMSANEGIEFAADVRGLDLVKRSFDDMIDTARRGGNNNQARIFTDMKDRMVREIDRKVPEYRQARQTFSSHKELEDAIETGRSFLKPSVDAEVAVKQIRAMSAGEREVARIGLARELKSVFDDPSRTLSSINKLINSDRIKTVTKELFPSAEAFNRFQGELRREAHMLRRGQQITGGSQTANKLAEGDDFDVGDVVGKVVSGRPIAAALSAVGQGGTRVAKGLTEKVQNSLGEMLSSADPTRQKAILDQIEQMLPPDAITKLLGLIAGRDAPIVQRALP